MRRHELAERILLELLDAQADALAFRVDRQHHGFEGVALLQLAGHVFASGVPAHVGRSEEHTSELQSLMRISYAVFCLKKKKKNKTNKHNDAYILSQHAP